MNRSGLNGIWILVALGPFFQAAMAAGDAGAYTGSAQCRRCHAEFHDRWSSSRHGLAMQPYTPALAAQTLGSQRITVRTAHGTYEVFGGAIREGDRKYTIEYALGGKNIYYFLTTLERGRLQVMPLAYDVRARAWIDSTASMTATEHGTADAPVDWRDRSLTFNTSCLGCHVSQLAANYDSASDSYRTEWREAGVSCETCHGPSAAHVRAPAPTNIIRFRTLSVAQRNDACASCHSKQIPVASGFEPGSRFFDSFSLVLLESDDYYPDGRDRRENYTYTSWLQSACVRSGQLDCLHCHTSSGRYRFSADRANDACLPCHQERVKNAAAHSHHLAASPASRCASCHMPATEYAHMRRTDHSMRPPAPAATIAHGSPNACNGCHSERDAAWADGVLRRWYSGQRQAKLLEREALIDAARHRDWRRLDRMLALVEGGNGDGGADEVVRTSLIRLLESCRDSRVAPALARAFRDPSPLIRASVIDTLASLAIRPSLELATILQAAVKDETRTVRIRAGAALAALGTASPAVDEYAASLRTRADDFAQRMNLGVFYSGAGQGEKALAEYEVAARLRPDYAPPLINAALVENELGRTAQAEERLRRAIAIDPANAAAPLNLGLLLAQQSRTPDAEAMLRKALALDPNSATAAYNLAVIVSTNRPDEAISLCRLAIRVEPDEPKYRAALAYFLQHQPPHETVRPKEIK
jgi:tetratricopeptide (TPR) repeat protein